MCKVLSFDQIVAPTVPFFSAMEIHNRMQEVGLSAMATPGSPSTSANSSRTESFSDSNSHDFSTRLRQPCFSPACPLRAAGVVQGTTQAK